ncbi:acetyltransferase [Frankia casuarinae]|uniref:GCN5-related N-acetyltransferase n=2 Tax=Frankia casuarinae (strain DSM 45818 / CECT 9043 / HFP020203 / CcI3) TaxID=106370 RepID=Q2JF92_FRACC|nr:GNAT family N-acetyltransferase [Frankia sp. CcI6]ABD10050.1 GCN5-related N-acetyltransferase [Frankia casuarinae]KDA45090.1 acetyltransferase [Frankia sp. BMG5.23]ETA04236.1 acetyltransferase [Frankia sp. CcI6]EYT92156.1 acetyltransferase [Frankia casuarinae]OAA22492.1 acetyltransferase [Frankia casuarinae]
MVGADDIRGRRIGPDEGMLLRRLRLAALTDAPSAFWQTLAEASALPAEEWDARARAGAYSSADLVAIVAVAGEAAGMVQGFTPVGRPWLRELGAMWVAPEARGTGAADTLLATAIDWARQAGAEAVKLWVVPGNRPARRLYARHGFLVLGGPKPVTDDPTVKVFVPMLLPLYPARPPPPADSPRFG